jgi:hypothetical protein
MAIFQCWSSDEKLILYGQASMCIKNDLQKKIKILKNYDTFKKYIFQMVDFFKQKL